MKKILSLVFLSFLLSCQQEPVESIHLSKKVIKKIYPGIVEVIIPKVEDKNITYARALPFDRLDYSIRKDKYNSIGTAFFISKNRLASAAHVFDVDSFSLWKDFYIRSQDGSVHQVKTIHRYDQHRDYIEFDLKTYPKELRVFELQEHFEIGDMVYAVGNAQGEGISTRGGQLSSLTPEAYQGKWKYIRFSSPASPGNSGGPLVNSQGKVIGVIVMKNQSENLNFALPINEISKVSKDKAEFFIRNLRVEDGNQMVTKNWLKNAPLPSSLEELRKVAIPARDQFYEDLIAQFHQEYKGELFPEHPRFRDYLRNQKFPSYSGEISKDANLNQWSISSPSLKKIKTSKEVTLFVGKGTIFPYQVLIERPKGKSIEELFLDHQTLMKSIIRGLGLSRSMAGETIPILSYSTPQKIEEWTDRLGRPFRSHYWNIHYNNTFLAIHSTPTPKGILNFIDVNWAGELNSGYPVFLRENILEIAISYRGSLKDWESFSKLKKAYIPEFLQEFKFSREKKGFSFELADFQSQIKGLKLTGQSEMILRAGYDPLSRLKAKILGVEVRETKNRHTGVLIQKVFSPSSLSEDDHLRRWQEIHEKTGRYNGETQLQNGSYNQRIKLSKAQESSFWPDKKIKSLYVGVCFSEPSKNKNWPEQICKGLAQGFKLK